MKINTSRLVVFRVYWILDYKTTACKRFFIDFLMTNLEFIVFLFAARNIVALDSNASSAMVILGYIFQQSYTDLAGVYYPTLDSVLK